MTTIGDVIEGKYEVLKLIGIGGMSKVYLAMDKRLNKQWAVKVMKKNTTDKNGEIVIQRAIAEADMIKQLDHPSIVRIVDIIDIGEEICIIEDYIEGETLKDVIEMTGAQPQSRVIDWAKQIANALEYLHTRRIPIIYRDMKPANIMLKPDGTIKIIDFGIAREYKDKNVADTETLGTKGYAAPEQFGGRGQTDARTDVYCLGVTLYHMITGKSPCEPPYQIYPIRYWNPQLSAGLEAIIQKCVQLNPMNRYQSCVELIYALNHYEQVSISYRMKQKRKIYSFIIMTSATVLTLIVGLISMVMVSVEVDASYDEKMIEAKNAQDSITQGEYYAQAIEIKPDEIEPYFDMVEAFKSDMVFTNEEEMILSSVLNTYMYELIEQEEYAQLAFEVGKLYWNYYDYGNSNSTDNKSTRMKESQKWFEDAVEYGTEEDEFYLMAKAFSDIAQFNENIDMNLIEGEYNDYQEYFKNLKDLIMLVTESEQEIDIVKLEALEFVLNEMEIHVNSFKHEGITEEEMMELYNMINQELREINALEGSKADEMVKEILDREEKTKDAIEKAYMQ